MVKDKYLFYSIQLYSTVYLEAFLLDVCAGMIKKKFRFLSFVTHIEQRLLCLKENSVRVYVHYKYCTSGILSPFKFFLADCNRFVVKEGKTQLKKGAVL